MSIPLDVKTLNITQINRPVNKLIANVRTSQFVSKCESDYNNSVMNVKVKPNAPITNQSKSGRCWMFATLNVIRRDFAASIHVKNFEFSYKYLYFYDKMEKYNMLINKINTTRDKPIHSKTIRKIFYGGADGGWFSNAVGLIKKYGLVPKTVYDESTHSQNTTDLNNVVKSLFTKYAIELRKSPAVAAENIIKEFNEKNYELLVSLLGKPPTTFNWVYENDNKQFVEHKNLTPLAFADKFVKVDFDDYITVVNDPNNKYEKTYLDRTENKIVGNVETKHFNLKMQTISKMILASLNDNKPVWFTCDVRKFMTPGNDKLDLNAKIDDILNIDTTISKKDELLTHQTYGSHAMVIIGCKTNNDIPSHWLVENSWGDIGTHSGNIVMTNKWMRRYAFHFVIHKKFFSEEHLKLITTLKPIIRKSWDPLNHAPKRSMDDSDTEYSPAKRLKTE